MRLVLYQPDIPQNTGTILRLGACLSVPVDIVEPCGFVWSEPRLRRAGMDYLDLAEVTRHESWDDFLAHRRTGRLVLLTTQGATPLPEARLEPTDLYVLGRESAGVPQEVHDVADMSLRIPMQPSARSLNVAAAAALVLGTALDRLGGWPSVSTPPSGRTPSAR